MLPSRPDRILLNAFAAATSTVAAGAIGTVIALAISPYAGIVAASVVALTLYLGARVRPDWLAVVYRQWRRLTRAYARVARRILVLIIHFLVMTPVARLGGDGGFWKSPAESGWLPHEPLRDPARRPGRTSRTRSRLSHGQTGAWVMGVVPLLAALRLLDRLDAQRREEVPTAMYTLY